MRLLQHLEHSLYSLRRTLDVDSDHLAKLTPSMSPRSGPTTLIPLSSNELGCVPLGRVYPHSHLRGGAGRPRRWERGYSLSLRPLAGLVRSQVLPLLASVWVVATVYSYYVHFLCNPLHSEEYTRRDYRTYTMYHKNACGCHRDNARGAQGQLGKLVPGQSSRSSGIVPGLGPHH